MNENLQGINNSYHSRNVSNENKKNFPEQDNDDIIKQLSQITPDDDKSFESSLMMTKNIPKFYEYKCDNNGLSKDSNITKSVLLHDIDQKNINEENLLSNNKYLLLNHKLKFICSLIQTSNINIKKYDDLIQYNTYLENINLLNHYEPINILFVNERNKKIEIL